MSQFKSSMAAVNLSRKTVLAIFSICLSSVFADGQSGGTGGIQRDPVTGCLLYDGVPAANCPARATGKAVGKQRSPQSGSINSQAGSFKEIHGSYYPTSSTSGDYSGDPCDVRDLVAKLNQLKDDDSAAANAETVRLGNQITSRMKDCQDSTDSGGGDARATPVPPPPLKLIDPGSFAAAGAESDPVDKGIQDILATEDDKKKQDCSALLNYRDTQLEHELEVAITQRDIYITQREKDFTLAKETLNLMNNDWWLGKLTGGHGEAMAEIATTVKFLTDEVNAFLSLFPAEDLEQAGAKILTKEHFDTFGGGAGPTVDTLRSWKEDGAQKAVTDAGKAAAWRIAEELNPVTAFLHGVLDYQDNLEGLEKFRQVTQQQVAQIVQTARNWQDKAAEAQSKADTIFEISQRISAYCSGGILPQQQGIPIGQPGGQGVRIGQPGDLKSGDH